ncbi:copper homeostasis protein CutC [Kaistella pullorum]|uniref:PF03932 family protein CutC n=1 Tax=Kaistella pullorum TaxID=2763074 RepID=A0ABR8WL22_9FLAO|nr:copper homeostasis protein CutC [Kaistella pullorum]MBD8017658.1 copper homeostasis protein CutC [Kaistella pullorum]
MLEIACFEMTSAETALRSMADRIEFCTDLELGGTTPDFYEFLHLKRTFSKPVYVMIRPKGGPFYYSETEFIEMKKSIISFGEAGADGFVFGILTPQNEVDVQRNAELITLAAGIPCTFHRAVDRTADLDKSVETLIGLGFKTVLTSGGKKSAMEGKENLKQLIGKYSNQIEILIGGGVRSENVAEIKEFTGATSFHSSAILKYDTLASAAEIKDIKKLIS